MLNMDFTVDLSVWQDGFVSSQDSASVAATGIVIPEYRSVFAEQLKKTETIEPEAPVLKQAPVVTPEVTLAAQEQKVQEMPSALADVVDLTPFIVSADSKSKPGERLNNEIDRTVFSKKSGLFAAKESPYNMSEEKAKARETAQASVKSLKGPGNAKVFSMEKAARFRDNGNKFGVAQPLTLSAADQAKQLRIEEMKQQARAKAVSETNTSLAKKPAIDPEAIRSQVSSEGFGYKRPNLPNTSSEKVSAAASWFPEAMTRQLDAYEAAKKVAQYGATGTEAKNLTDIAI